MEHADLVGADILRELGIDGGGDLPDPLEILGESIGFQFDSRRSGLPLSVTTAVLRKFSPMTLSVTGPSPRSTTRGAMSSISGAGRSGSGRGIGFLNLRV